MSRGQEHFLENIMDDVWVTVFTATNTAMMQYPYILNHPDECSPTLADMAETHIMDSKIMDESVGNGAVLDCAMAVGSDVVTPADVLHDPATTTDRIVELFELLDSDEYEGFNPEVMLPLQPDPDAGENHVDHYFDLVDTLTDKGIDITNHRLSVGGIKEWSSHQQLDVLCRVRGVVGDEQYLHGLGFGATQSWIATFRRCPNLVDSVDMSSVAQDIINSNVLLTPTLERVAYTMPRGQNSTVLTTRLREHVLYLLSYYLGPHVRESDAPTTIQNESMRQVLQKYDMMCGTDSQSAYGD